MQVPLFNLVYGGGTMGKYAKILLRRYKDDIRGQFAVWFAILALPLMLGVSMAIDMQKMNKDSASVKSALDAAVLATVSNSGLTQGQAREFALRAFREK